MRIFPSRHFLFKRPSQILHDSLLEEVCLKPFASLGSCHIGVAIKDTFTNQHTANIGQLPLNTLIFQDDISKMNDDIEQAREGCQKIDRTLKSKLLSENYDKSKFLIMGKEKSRKSTLEIL